MGRLTWRDSATATAPPRVRVDRFRGSTRRTVHLLGEVRCIQTHRKRFAKDEDKENTIPCLAPEPCPFCANPLFHTRDEHFGPALFRNNADSIWEPIVAVFTPGGWNQFKRQPAGPHRGRVLSVFRTPKGSVPGGVLNVVLKERVEPAIPGFDVEPHLLAMWFPADEVPPADTPQAVPFTARDLDAEAKPRPLSPETSRLAQARSSEYLGRMDADELLAYATRLESAFPKIAAQAREEAAARLQKPAEASPVAPPPSAEPAAATGASRPRPASVLAADPAAQAELARRRALKPADGPVEAPKVFDNVLAMYANGQMPKRKAGGQ